MSISLSPLDSAVTAPFLEALHTFQQQVFLQIQQAQHACPELADLEPLLIRSAQQAVCAALSSICSAAQPVASELRVEGILYRAMATPSLGTYFSLSGAFQMRRFLYRQIGLRNGPTVVPLDLQLGLVDGRWTPKAAEAVAHLLQDEPSRDAVQTCAVLGVLPYSRCTLERGGQTMGHLWEVHREVLETELMETMEIPTEATAVAVSVDRVSLPMVEAPEAADANSAAKQAIVYRMAYCGIWTLYNVKGEAVYARRYGRMPSEGHAGMEESLRGDLKALLTKRPDLEVVALADGAAEMQGMLDRIIQEVSGVKRGTLDLWHVLEYLGAAIQATGHTKEKLETFKRWLRTEAKGVEHVEQVLWAWRRSYLPDQIPKALAEACRYLANNRSRMRYKALIDTGLPVGSGPVEATCKTLVSTRMKRSGARWKPVGGQQVLNLRGLARSSQWDPGMKALFGKIRRNVQAVERCP